VDTARAVLSIAILLSAGLVVVGNWGCVIGSFRNRRRGIDKHHSTVPMVSLVLSLFAYGVYPYSPKNWMFILSLLDPSNWSLLAIPFVFFRMCFCDQRPDQP